MPRSSPRKICVGAVTEQGTPVGNLTDSGSISFTDVDLTDVHLVSATGTPIGTTLGTLTAVKDTDTTGSGGGGQLTWTYTVADAAVEYLAAGQTKVESFTITLDDQHGGLITRQIDVTITGTNDAPVITAGAQTGTVNEDTHVTATGQVSSSDVDHGATATTAATPPAPMAASRSTRRPGAWTYTLDNAAPPEPGRGREPDRDLHRHGDRRPRRDRDPGRD